jgi:hypothetical protein
VPLHPQTVHTLISYPRTYEPTSFIARAARGGLEGKCKALGVYVSSIKIQNIILKKDQKYFRKKKALKTDVERYHKLSDFKLKQYNSQSFYYFSPRKNARR